MGAIAGVVHNYAFDFVSHKLKIDDPVGAIPVHGFCGLTGTLLLALLADESKLNLPRLQQLGIQLLGGVVAFAWAAGLGYVVFIIIKKVFGLRVSPAEERAGISIPGLLKEEISEDESEGLDEKMLSELMGGK
jgi:Amt family ammonium transporter